MTDQRSMMLSFTDALVPEFPLGNATAFEAQLRKHSSRLLALAAGLALSLHLHAASPRQVYLSPNGNDADDGRSAEHAIKTLMRAQDIVVRESPREANDAEIRIAPGSYVGQSVKWSFSMPAHTITFLPTADDRQRPVFEGDGTGTWFSFIGRTDGVPTNLVFKHIQVRNYQTAISFSGSRRKLASSSRGNVIDGCSFLRIGENSTAAVRLTNSSGNWIMNSHFVSIVSRSDGFLLHAIYAAHASSGNFILHNRFETCSGDPIRFRDGSNGNVVEGNLFVGAGVEGAVTDWFCDHDTESDCTKPTAECPSWSNRVKDNILDRTFVGGSLPATHVYSERIPSGCTKPSIDAKRMVATGNRRP